MQVYAMRKCSCGSNLTANRSGELVVHAHCAADAQSVGTRYGRRVCTCPLSWVTLCRAVLCETYLS